MGFIRQQEESLALRLLKWHYQRVNHPETNEIVLKERASRLVDEAHQIAKKRGRNVLSILKEMVNDMKKE